MNTLRTIYAILLSALLSLQALAAVAVPCSVADPGMIATEQSADMDGHAHRMPADDTQEGTVDCCDAGYCSQGGCLSLVPFASSEYVAITATHLPIHPQLVKTSPRHHPNLLFRPPTA